MAKIISLSMCAFIIFFNGCITVKPLRLEPADPSVVWNQGIPYAKAEDERIVITIGFIEHVSGQSYFDVTIKNKSRTEIVADAVNFMYLTPVKLEKQNQAKDLALEGTTQTEFIINAIDPEWMLSDINRRIDEENKSYEIDSGVNAAAGCLGAASTVSSGESDPEFDEQINDDADTIERGHKNEIQKLNAEKTYWKTQTLRKTTLQYNQEIRGAVVFDMRKNIKKAVINYIYNGYSISIPFVRIHEQTNNQQSNGIPVSSW